MIDRFLYPLSEKALSPCHGNQTNDQQINWLISNLHFSFDISSEYHACKKFHIACKTSDI